MCETFEVTINRLGNQGDGVATHEGKPVFVPFSLEGEKIYVSGKGARKDIVSIVKSSPERADPFCKYFGLCGGCQLQHFSHAEYLKWKTETLIDVFRREDISIIPEAIRHYPRANRRRAVFTAIIKDGNIALGYSQKNTNTLLDIENCPILVLELNQAIEDVKNLALILIGKHKSGRVTLLKTMTGLDIAFSIKSTISDKTIRETIAHPSAKKFIRISVNDEAIIETKQPLLKIGKALVRPVPEGFVQASLEAEQDMADLVCGHFSKSKKVADLFCGFGTFALRLAENSQIYAAENSESALQALDRAWRETGGKLKLITHEKRDLYRRPMITKELKSFDGVVFDPPRAGAELQCRELAKSKIQKVAAISCNPQTLARDIKILVGGGFKIKSITPFDQFAFTPHLETVVLMER